MKILFVNTNTIKPQISPVGLEYVAEHLNSQGHETKIVDSDNISMKSLSDYSLIGLSIRNIDNTGFRPVEFYLPRIKKLIEGIRKKTRASIVIGGPAVNLMPYEVEKFLGVDHAVAHEGFGSLDCLIESVEDKCAIKDVVGSNDNWMNRFFKRDIINHSKYKEGGVGVSTKFGCPFSCVYCNYPLIGMGQRAPDSVGYEIGMLQKQGVNNIFFTDANFNVPSDHGVRILKELNKRNEFLKWEAFINPRPEAFTDEFFNEVVNSGKKTISFGADSLSERGLALLRKGFTVKDIYRVTKLCQSKGMKVNYSILFGHPDETESEVLETFSNIDRLKPEYVDVVVGIRLFPKTPLHNYCLSKGIATKEQSLLEPYYITLPKSLENLIMDGVNSRPNCHLSNPLSLYMYRD